MREVLDEDLSIEEMGERIFEKIIKTASGEPTKVKSWEWAITNLFHGKLALLCKIGFLSGFELNFLGDKLLEPLEEDSPSSKPLWSYADCHAQILGPPDTYPLNQNSDVKIDNYSTEEYAKFREDKNINRTVLVQPEHHGTNNTCLLDAISSLNTHPGEDKTFQIKGIIKIESNLEDEKLESLSNLGVVGAKFEMRRGFSGLGWDEADRLAWRI